MPAKGQSRYAAHREAIAALAAEGLVAHEIQAELELEGTPRGLRKYMQREGIEGQPTGGRPGELNHRWTGGVMVSRGYRHVARPGHPRANPRTGYVREHILVMEEKLGRALEPGEVVHHIDDDPSNNDPANLELFASNGEHLAVTRKGKRPNWTPEGLERLEALWESRRQAPTE